MRHFSKKSGATAIAPGKLARYSSSSLLPTSAFLLVNDQNCHLSLVLASVVQGDAVNCNTSSKSDVWSNIKKPVRSFLKTFNVFLYFHQNVQIETSTWYIQGLAVFFSLKPLHSLQYLTTNLTFKILHSYHSQCAHKTMKRFSTTASSKPKKPSKIMHKQPLTYQR